MLSLSRGKIAEELVLPERKFDSVLNKSEVLKLHTLIEEERAKKKFVWT